MVEAYEEMRRMLSQIAASGVELPNGKHWQGESARTHVTLAFKHLRRFFVLLFCGRRPQLDPDYRVDASGYEFDDDVDDGEVKRNEDGVPDAKQLARRGLIVPENGSWKEKWDLLILMLILYSAVVVPMRVCFDAEAEGMMWNVDVAVTFLFILDMYFTFNTVYFDPETGEWVIDRWRIAKSYMQSWFWIDAPSSMPVEVIDYFMAGEPNGALGLLRVLRLFRLLRLLRLLKIEQYVETLEERFDVNLRALRILFMLVKICFLAHGLGCFWYGVHMLHASSWLDPTGEQPTWALEYDDGRPASADTPLKIRYLYSVYWSVTTLTTVGYGDVVPKNTLERTFALGTMLVSAIVFGYLISNIGAMVASIDRQAAKVEERLDSVKEYVRFRRLPRDLATRVKKHYSFYFTQRSSFDEVDLLAGLPPSLGSEVTRYVLKETLGRLPLFRSITTDPEFQAELFPLIKPVSYQPGEVIFKRGEPSIDIVFLLAGEVAVLSPFTNRVTSKLTPTEEIFLSSETPPQKVMALTHMGAFGSTMLTGRRRTMTHVASLLCQVLVLSKQDYDFITAKDPRSCRKIKDVLLAEVARKERMQVLYMRFVIGSLHGINEPKAVARRSCLIIQKAWKRYANYLAGLEADESGDAASNGPSRLPSGLAGCGPSTSAKGTASRLSLSLTTPPPSERAPSAAKDAANSAGIGGEEKIVSQEMSMSSRGKLSRKKKLRLIAQTEQSIANIFSHLKSQLGDLPAATPK